MRLHPEALSTLLRPIWLAIIILAVLASSGGALWFGLQQDQGETSTTFVFGSRIGFDAPLAELEDHIADIVNSVEFPAVFTRIESRTLLREGDDYDLDISILEDTQSVVAIEVRTDRSGEADRISRIIAEEMVRFVLERIDTSVSGDLDELARELTILNDDQARLVALAGGANPTLTEISLERELVTLTSATDTADTDTAPPPATLEDDLRDSINVVAPLAAEYRQNQLLIAGVSREMADINVQRSEISGALRSISSDWYRSITPVEPTSNVPVAIAMAFAAAVPTLIAAVALVGLNVNRRLNSRDRAFANQPSTRVAAA